MRGFFFLPRWSAIFEVEARKGRGESPVFSLDRGLAGMFATDYFRFIPQADSLFESITDRIGQEARRGAGPSVRTLALLKS
jgi:hypothetical protein